MAQLALSRSPIGVELFWEKGAQPTTIWAEWFTTIKSAISSKKKRETTSSETNSSRTGLSKRTKLCASTSRRNHIRKTPKRADKYEEKSRLKNTCQSVEDRGPMPENLKWAKQTIHLSEQQQQISFTNVTPTPIFENAPQTHSSYNYKKH